MSDMWTAPISGRPLPHIADEDYHGIVADNEYAMRPGSYDWDAVERELLALNDKRAAADTAARVAELEEALQALAQQNLPDEMDDDQREHADYEFAYVSMVKIARAALGRE